MPGETVYIVLTSKDSIMSTLTQHLATHIQTHQTHGFTWPDTAEFCVVYNTSTWPCGWSDYNVVRFFDSAEEFKAWLVSNKKWSSYEDNHLAYMAWEWDLGPNLIDSCDESNLAQHSITC